MQRATPLAIDLMLGGAGYVGDRDNCIAVDLHVCLAWRDASAVIEHTVADIEFVHESPLVLPSRTAQVCQLG